jgi:hypothetical protein
MGLFLFWLGMAFVTGIAASARGRSGGAWFCLGFLFSIFALIAVLVMPRLDPESKTTVATNVPAPLPATTSATSVAEEIEKLAQLRDKGILTDAEFQARKGVVLKS